MASLFTPAVMVDGDKIKVDFSDSFQYSHDEDGFPLVEDNMADIDLMDKVLGLPGTKASEQLRRLADYIEAQGG